MKNKIWIFLAGCLFFGGIVYAANGDLIVNNKLGIGTATPGSDYSFVLLDVFGSSNPTMRVGNGATSIGMQAYTSYGGGPVGWVGTMSNSKLTMGANGRLDMTIDTTGRVAIGTTYPGTYMLYVNGPFWASSGPWGSSDIKLKKNILPISEALGTVLKLKGVSYEWKDDYYKVKESLTGPEVLKKKDNPEGRHYGVIAQEIEQVLPEVVREGAEGTKGVNYSAIIPVLIEAIKEQQSQIENLVAEVDMLKKAI